jgi:uncharacterized protein YdiU (UPF0061 family)
LFRLADALELLIDLDTSKSIIRNTFKKEFSRCYLETMRKKLGLFEEMEGDQELIESFKTTMFETCADFTNSFRALSKLELNGKTCIEADIESFLAVICGECCSAAELKEIVKPKFKPETLEKLLEAVQENPHVLQYYGLSEELVKNEVSNMERFVITFSREP